MWRRHEIHRNRMMQSDDLLTSSERTRTSTTPLVLGAMRMRDAAAYTLRLLQGEEPVLGGVEFGLREG